jgi:hypothetical protein
MMPVGVARVDQPLAASRTGHEQAKTVGGEIPNQLVAGLRQQWKRPDEGFLLVLLQASQNTVSEKRRSRSMPNVSRGSR